MVLITQFSINMLVPIFLCSFGGLYLDKWLGTSYLFILFFFVGATAGFRNIYIFAKKIYDDKDVSRDQVIRKKTQKTKQHGEGIEKENSDVQETFKIK